jgi:hypothetical protein
MSDKLEFVADEHTSYCQLINQLIDKLKFVGLPYSMSAMPIIG